MPKITFMDRQKVGSFLTLAFFFFLVGMTSCKKDGGKAPSDTAQKQFTERTWFYYEYFTSYSESSSTLVYKLEKPYNLLDLSSTRFKFKADNTFEETLKDVVTAKGTWVTKSNSEIDVKDEQGLLIFTIVTVKEGFLVWSNKEKDTYGTMLSQ